MDLDVAEEEMTMIQTQGIMIITGILIEGLLISLEEALEGMIHLEVQVEILHEEDFLDLIPGVTQGFHFLVRQGGLEVQEGLGDQQGLKGQVETQELFIFLILMLDQSHHHFSSSLTLQGRPIGGMGILVLLNLKLGSGTGSLETTVQIWLYLGSDLSFLRMRDGG